jgi:ferric-dicitrate binding protein FerR (iron transport regulator)/TolA-binding protein
MLRDEESGLAPDASVAQLAELAHDHLGKMSDVQEARGLHDAVASFARLGQMTAGKGRSSRRFWLATAGATAALATLAVLVGPSLVRKKPLTFAMTAGEIQAGGYFRAGIASQPTLQFSDGTRLDLVAGARGRVASVDAHGARVMLDEGEAHVRVVPRADTRWLFEAGPFVVQVRGTEFALAWRGAEGRLDVRLDKGAVSVTGPLSGQAIVLRPGQWLTVRLAAHEVFVRDFDRAAPPSLSSLASPPEPAAAAVPTEAPPPPGPEPSPVAPRAHRPAHAAALPANPEAGWAPARAEGDWVRILDQATKRGIDRTLAERNNEDLALLADAAHYQHRDDIAEQALLAQRQRFPGSTRAKDAAFLIGRIVEAKPGGASEALVWYDRHLAEAPSGAYVSETLGRKMTVLARLRGDAAARPVAEEYLRRYPGGTYARAARAYASKP